MKNSNKTHVISFRMSDEELEPFKHLMTQANLKKSELFKSIVISKSKQVNLIRNEDEHYRRLLFLYNKISNNVNQIARVTNTLHKNHSLNDQSLLKINNNLLLMNDLLRKGLSKC